MHSDAVLPKHMNALLCATLQAFGAKRVPQHLTVGLFWSMEANHRRIYDYLS